MAGEESEWLHAPSLLLVQLARGSWTEEEEEEEEGEGEAPPSSGTAEEAGRRGFSSLLSSFRKPAESPAPDKTHAEKNKQTNKQIHLIYTQVYSCLGGVSGVVGLKLHVHVYSSFDSPSIAPNHSPE